MKFKDLNEANAKLYMMLSCEDGTFAGSDKISDLWSFAMEKVSRCGLMGSSIYYMCVVYEDGTSFEIDKQLALFKFIRDFRTDSVRSGFKQSVERDIPLYIEFVTDSICFRIGTQDKFKVFDEDDDPCDISKIAKGSVKKLNGFFFDQII
jgi:hypothetical protein